jgi:hypothetical protein
MQRWGLLYACAVRLLYLPRCADEEPLHCWLCALKADQQSPDRPAVCMSLTDSSSHHQMAVNTRLGDCTTATDTIMLGT